MVLVNVPPPRFSPSRGGVGEVIERPTEDDLKLFPSPLEGQGGGARSRLGRVRRVIHELP